MDKCASKKLLKQVGGYFANTEATLDQIVIMLLVSLPELPQIATALRQQKTLETLSRFGFELCNWWVGMPATPPAQIVTTLRHQGTPDTWSKFKFEL